MAAMFKLYIFGICARRRARGLLLWLPEHSLTKQDKGVRPQSKMDNEPLRRAAVCFAVTIKACLPPQSSRIDADPMADPAGESGRQLVEPILPDRIPAAVHVSLNEFLAASSCAVDTTHDAEQGRASS